MLKIFGKEVSVHLNWGYNFFYYIVYNLFPYEYNCYSQCQHRPRHGESIIKWTSDFILLNTLSSRYLKTSQELILLWFSIYVLSPCILAQSLHLSVPPDHPPPAIQTLPKMPQRCNYSHSSTRSKGFSLQPFPQNTSASLSACSPSACAPTLGFQAIFSSMEKREIQSSSNLHTATPQSIRNHRGFLSLFGEGSVVVRKMFSFLMHYSFFLTYSCFLLYLCLCFLLHVPLHTFHQ